MSEERIRRARIVRNRDGNIPPVAILRAHLESRANFVAKRDIANERNPFRRPNLKAAFNWFANSRVNVASANLNGCRWQFRCGKGVQCSARSRIKRARQTLALPNRKWQPLRSASRLLY